MSEKPEILTERLWLRPFTEADAPALAPIIGDPAVARSVMVNVSDPGSWLAAAQKRIAWHNCWDDFGFGIWAVCLGPENPEISGRLLGWCGFAPPDDWETDGALEPELLYGIGRPDWRQGYAEEAARAALDWFFRETPHHSVAALIFTHVNPSSIRLAEKLGMRREGGQDVEVFCPELSKREDIIAFELWRLKHQDTSDLNRLGFETGYRAGLFCGARIPSLPVAERFREAARQRGGAAMEETVIKGFEVGQSEPSLARYRIRKSDWLAR